MQLQENVVTIKSNSNSNSNIVVKDVIIKTIMRDGIDYICITDIARQKNPIEPKDVVKNWMRQKNTLEYLGLWEKLNNPMFKGGEFDPLFNEAGSNSFTMSPSRWIELTGAMGIITKNGAGGGTYAQSGRSRCAECRNIWDDCQRMESKQSRCER